VPEAFHLLPPGPGGFASVHVLTSSSEVINPGIEQLRNYFREYFPDTPLTITRVDGFMDLQSESDHFHFEEVLLRWIIATEPHVSQRYLCLAGGFKTMSAAMQRAGYILGAAEIFHVLAPSWVSTSELIHQALQRSEISFVRLGAELGWPQLRSALCSEYPLALVREDAFARTVRSVDQRLRVRIQDILRRSHHIARSWDTLANLPFTEVATWSEADLEWLCAPLDPSSSADQSWVARLPKIELHCHLGGFATDEPLLSQVRSAATEPGRLPTVQPIATPSGWPTPVIPIGLEAYRHLGDNNGSALLRDSGCLRAQCALLYQQFLEQRIVYAEVRCSPANYADATIGRSPWDVLVDIRSAFDSALQAAMIRKEADPSAPQPCRVNLIIIGTRQTGGDFRAGISRHLALAVTAAEHTRLGGSCQVVGVDLAGFEDVSTRAHYFREEFTAVHRCGLALTVHAGENDDAEGIWRAVFDLNARRIGHGLSLGQSPDLQTSVTDRNIAVELCPYANFQIRGFNLPPAIDEESGAAPQYPLLKYLRRGMRVTINTDNIGISGASLTDNLLFAARLCPGLTRMELLQLQRHALDAAFISPEVRSQMLSAMKLPSPAP
jgi:adenosine deaminase